ncbi:hypothetical protein NUH86_03925 [Sphingobium sp. JS3065]|uniref:hypothetical protein n=1 Tax=Sphingobium sp. JS3065 TaxID=2970925 RepID=UPI002263B111|nr:hypothetical protein [Sphingobium sp. JS3065]UZW55951.1 hypothetical protein NUH86_03925 [Sphingobium sp. JS3065]
MSGGRNMNIYDPVFSSSQVAHAAGMTASNFRAHLARGNWRIIGEAQPAEVFGKGHLFTIYDAVGFALAHQLVTRGVEPKLAFELAMFDFAHIAAGPLPGTELTRQPGGVFDREQGYTLYVYCPGAQRGQCIATADIRDAVELIIAPEGSVASSAIIINLNDLRSRVFNALGLEERDYD